jgi:hypothetical protein
MEVLINQEMPNGISGSTPFWNALDLRHFDTTARKGKKFLKF